MSKGELPSITRLHRPEEDCHLKRTKYLKLASAVFVGMARTHEVLVIVSSVRLLCFFARLKTSFYECNQSFNIILLIHEAISLTSF